VVDGGNGRIEILTDSGEQISSYPLGQVAFSAAPLGEDAIIVYGVLGSDQGWTKIDAAGNQAPYEFPDFETPEGDEGPVSRGSTWGARLVRLRYTSPQVRIYSEAGTLETVIDIPLSVEEASDDEIEEIVREVSSTLARDELPSAVIQQQVERIRARPRAKRRFRKIEFDDEAGLAAVWEQNPEDFGSGNASLHLLSIDGIYLAALEFDRPWADFALTGGMLYVLARDPETDLITLMAHELVIPPRLLDRAQQLSRQVSEESAAGSRGQERETVLDSVVTVHDSIFTEIPAVPPLCDELDLTVQRVEVGDATLYVEVQGDGPAMVLISGGPGTTHNMFHPWFDHAASFSRVIYYDQRGTGRSDFEPGVDGYSVDQAIGDLDRLRVALGLERWIVLGHSYGGFLAQYYALRYPERVAGLVLVGASPNMWEYRERSRQFSLMPREQLNRILEVRREVSAWSQEAGLTELQSTALSIYNAFLNGDWKRQHFYRPTPEEIARIALYGWKPDPDGLRSQIGASMDPVDLRGAFVGSPIPTLIMEGMLDLTWAGDKAATLHANHPGSELEMLVQAAHSPFMDEPEAFFETLEEVVAGLTGVSAAEIEVFREQVVAWDRRVRESVQYLLRTTGDDSPSYRSISSRYSPDWLPLLAKSIDYFYDLQRVGFALYEAERLEEAAVVFRSLADTAEAKGDSDNIPRYVGLVWEGHMLDLMGRRTEAVERYTQAAEMQLEGSWSHPQYALEFAFTAYAEERVATPFQRVPNTEEGR
jgi:proline iminopeptidase